MAVENFDFDNEYSEGKWDYLDSISELAHYSVIEGYCQYYTSQSSPAILDMGCGEGLLLKYIRAKFKTNYSGVDISKIAIQKAKNRFPNSKFVCETIEKFNPGANEKYDLIIFNEVLYYFDAPDKELDRYRSFLAPHGKIIVSMFDGKNLYQEHFDNIVAYWKTIEKGGWVTLSETHVLDVPSKKTWQVRVLELNPPKKD